MTSLKKKILSSHPNATVFSEGEGIYLVGGYIRDLLNKGIHSRDRDFVVAEEVGKIAERVARALGAKVVRLGKEKIIRVVLASGTTLDFSRMRGDIVNDLGSRDYTVNAMGWSPSTGLLDPHRGVKDLNDGYIRGISKTNFISDPVRLLRAYRFSGENKWRIVKGTRESIKELSHALGQSPRERITLEFFKLLNADEPEPALKAAIYDGVLSEIIPLSKGKLQENIKLFSKTKKKLNKLPDTNYFKEFSHGLTGLGLIRLEALLKDASLEDTRLSMSRDIYKRITVIQLLYNEFSRIDFKNKGEVFDLFSRAENATPDLLILSDHIGEYDKFSSFIRIKEKGTLTSDEIMSLTGIGPGKRLGNFIYDLRRLQFEGKIKNKYEAKVFLKSNKKENTDEVR